MSLVNGKLNLTNECILLKNECSFQTEFGEVWLRFAQTPVVEVELYIDFKLPEAVQIENSFIMGKEMYMGRTAVLFEEDNPSGDAVTFLGSCNLPEMEWVLTLNYKAGDQKGSLSVYFSTSQ